MAKNHSYPDRSTIEGTQLEQLRSLLAELFPGNKFYARKLNSAGITFDVSGLQDYSARFPFTTKQELSEDQRRHPPFGSNLTYPVDRYTRFHQTSGTSSLPLRWLDTPESWEWMLESWTEILKVAGVGPADRVFFAFSFGPFIGFWMAFESAERLGCLCVPGGGLRSAARVQTIIDNGITVLCSTPTYALRLAEVAHEEKIDLSAAKVRILLVAGEPGGSIPGIRSRLCKQWPGARVFDHHGMTEVGPVTYECPTRPGVLHVIESAYYAEIVHPTSGEALPSGEIGELVLTTLGRTGSPLLRYRTGDLVRSASSPGENPRPCSCGRFELALEGGILGRADDMVVIRGVNVYPSAVEEIVRSCEGVAEYRVEINTTLTLPELSLQVEPTPDCVDFSALVHGLERAFETALALRVPVTLASTGALPRFEMKAKRWVKIVS